MSKQYWFDLETTSDNELVVNEIFLEKPDYETDHHVIDFNIFSQAMQLLRRAKIILADNSEQYRHYFNLKEDIATFEKEVNHE